MRDWQLCSAVIRCQWRRLRARACGHRLAAGICIALAALAPVALLVSSRIVARELGPSLTDLRIARAVVLGAALPAVASGVVLALAADGGRALGQQVRAAPVSRRTLLAASVVLPALALSAVAVPLAVPAILPLALAAPGGTRSAVPLCGTLVAAVTLGAAFAEAARAAWRGSRPALGALGAGAGIVTGASAAPSLAPFELTASALAGQGSAWPAASLATGWATLAAVGWLVLAASRPEPRPRRRLVSRRMPGRGPLVVIQGAAMLLLRRPDIRSSLVAAAALAVGAVVACRIAAAAPPSAALLAGTAVAIATVPLSLSTGGVIVTGAAVWRTATISASRIVGSWTIASLSPVLVLATAAATTASAVEGGRGAGIGQVVAVAALAGVVGLLAGALVPWRVSGTGDQFTALACCLTLSVVASVLAALVGPRLEALGIPAPLAAAALLGSAGIVASLTLTRLVDGGLGARPR